MVVAEGNAIPLGVIWLVRLCHHLTQFIFIMQFVFIFISLTFINVTDLFQPQRAFHYLPI
jgi:hypothetical protein